MRLLVTGSRYATREKHFRVIEDALRDWYLEEPADFHPVLVHGAARGADILAARIWASHGLPVEDHPADWTGLGKAAGFIRNQEMVDLGADFCLAFPIEGLPNAGTSHCLARAEAAGIPTRTVWLEP